MQEFSASYGKLNFSLQIGKTWNFIKNSKSQTILNSLVIARGHKENQIKNNRVASHKAHSL
jgi:hypothetical protein